MCLAVIGRISAVDGDHAVVDVDGADRRVSLAMVLLEQREVGVGDWVLVHTGIAMSVLGPDEADEALRLRRELRNVGGSSS